MCRIVDVGLESAISVAEQEAEGLGKLAVGRQGGFLVAVEIGVNEKDFFVSDALTKGGLRWLISID